MEFDPRNTFGGIRIEKVKAEENLFFFFVQ